MSSWNAPTRLRDAGDNGAGRALLWIRRLISRPNYAETWNRRANLYYATDDYPGAIAAIQETLKREPRHFAALAALA
jgi:tetratricopeptide (TPR) repeat protein